ncbi:MAG TPA: hypothetical protein DEB30_01755 [Candidatus Peribacter riflensis]|uniref:Putative Prepilin peptidase n=1 Tax=Candidatus Peribacter riflensis TaxID=1735162 RepID=A0A0S1SQA4_9BACT|nr:MAG: putative Prepilin peptidase [Candidatus Peribacter riflensis]OGJ76580.1 MAG: hypothetical protein A2398_04190 [Candidatus Peribacteria bacterium RIFOXYB1_FULL_57_12]OGJ82841.1 MAG: hypothetical protein A2412_01675 [Candidatus Peribacteria bacterium RIFOXYC1_FULL_58_8]ALM11489.1 MAG: putative Prepilin peptidase [Candidatus Peribacter riflensis]ALM12591.1 MAG: putative Prepilin peptidase [Candidatus Peribacter riflensis]
MYVPDLSLAILFGILGLVFGSFGTVLIARLPAGQHIGGRSRCPRCKHMLGVAELIPLVSYCFLSGRCRHCRRSIGVLYPLIELGSALLFLLALLLVKEALSSLLLALALWLLLLIAVMDARTQSIHDLLNFSLIAFAVAYAVSVGSVQIAAPLLLGAFFGGQWVLSRGRWVGSGDILLGIGVGFLLGDWMRALLCLGLAYILGAMVASYLLLLHKASRKSHIPFGPFLAGAALLTIMFGDRILGLLVPGFFL